MDELISVIVPAFNAAPYLEACIQSIQKQTFPNWELILVDDGSTDGTSELCDRLEAEDKRIRVIHKANAGVSAARNDGIDRAKGEYIAFVDADDLVHPQYLELLLEGIHQTGTDISLCSFTIFQDGEAAPFFSNIEPAAFEKVERRALLASLSEPSCTASQCMVIPWVKLCRACCYENLRFPERVRHEDEFLAHHLLGECSFAAVSTVPLYYYRRHADSFMGTGERGWDLKYLDIFNALEDRITYFAQEEPSLICGAVHNVLREASGFYADYSRRREPIYQGKRKWLRQLYRRYYFRYFHFLDYGERLKGALFLIWPIEYYRLAQWRWKHRNE